MFSGISEVPQPKSNTASVEKSETKVSADIPKDQRTHKIRIMKINIFSFLSTTQDNGQMFREFPLCQANK